MHWVAYYDMLDVDGHNDMVKYAFNTAMLLQDACNSLNRYTYI